MRKLTEEEARKIPSKKAGKQSAARAYLMSMEVDDIIMLERKEWNQLAKSPMELIRRIRKATKRDFSCETILDGSGWIMKRLQ